MRATHMARTSQRHGPRGTKKEHVGAISQYFSVSRHTYICNLGTRLSMAKVGPHNLCCCFISLLLPVICSV